MSKTWRMWSAQFLLRLAKVTTITLKPRDRSSGAAVFLFTRPLISSHLVHGQVSCTFPIFPEAKPFSLSGSWDVLSEALPMCFFCSLCLKEKMWPDWMMSVVVVAMEILRLEAAIFTWKEGLTLWGGGNSSSPLFSNNRVSVYEMAQQKPVL